jgi:hypothetical protein
MKLACARIALLAIGGLLAVLPTTAHADVADAASCSTPVLFSPLRSFGDWRSYFVAPGGDFERSSWTLSGGATLTSGSGPLRLGAARTSLRLPPGATATSPRFCVDLDYPTLRYFSSKRVAMSTSQLRVGIFYPAIGQNNASAQTVANGASAWALSKDVKLRPERVDRLGGWRLMQIRFSADRAATGDWRVDDVLVDPRMRG